MKRKYTSKRLSLLFAIGIAGCGAGTKTQSEPATPPAVSDAGTDTEESALPVLADVTAFVLTKCPYAAEAIQTLVALRREMGAQININLGYIGLVDAEGNIDEGMAEAERRTAALQVCVSAKSTPSAWFDYLGCVYEGEKWRTLPSSWEGCVSKAGIAVDDVRQCIDSGNGDIILAQAYGASMGSRISGSPTIFVDGYLYGGERTVDAMKQHICYVTGKEETRPSICADVPRPQKIEATIVYDPRCAGLAICDVEGEIAVLEQVIPGFALSRVPFSTEEGRALYDAVQAAKIGARKLPLVVIDNALNTRASLKELLGDYLLPFGEGYVFTLGGGWDPLAEICNNGEDDNADGKTDCADSTCEKKLICRPELPRRLDLFAMSECPFTLEMLPAVDQLLNHFDRDNDKVDFNLQFIGDVDKDKTFNSMHGQSEVDEDLRMICAQSLYRKKYKFMEYVLCRAKDVRDPSWEACVPKGMSKRKIRACAEGKKGRALLEESFYLADALGVTGSPTWVLNNREFMNARRTGEMLTQYCARNELSACETPPELSTSEESTPQRNSGSCQ